MTHYSSTFSSRRTFLKSSAALLAGPLVLPRSVFGANAKLNLAWVGVGNMGWNDLRSCAHDNDVVAICDCDKRTWERAKKQFPQARFYVDFREMLTEMGDSIDAVGVGTPDHTHFAITCMALRMGKHVFVEKPLAHSLRELRTLQELAAEKDVITQMGNQGHAFEGARLVKEWYEAGIIGEVKEIITWTDRPAGGYCFTGQVQIGFPAAQPVPAGLNWDVWLGPVTTQVAYNRTFHPGSWRPWWDFGCGGLGDIGCHTIDTPYWAMGLGDPERVEVDLQEPANPIYTPNGSVVTYVFPARGSRPPVTLKWYEGPRVPEAPEGFDGKIDPRGGMIMVGADGGIYHNGMRPNSPMLYPRAKWQAYRQKPEKRVPKTLPRTKGIHRDWINGIKTGKKSCSDFSYSAPLTEQIVLGTLAIRTGKGLKWDSKALAIHGNPEASKLIGVPARKGWRTEDL